MRQESEWETGINFAKDCVQAGSDARQVAGAGFNKTLTPELLAIIAQSLLDRPSLKHLRSTCRQFCSPVTPVFFETLRWTPLLRDDAALQSCTSPLVHSSRPSVISPQGRDSETLNTDTHFAAALQFGEILERIRGLQSVGNILIRFQGRYCRYRVRIATAYGVNQEQVLQQSCANLASVLSNEEFKPARTLALRHIKHTNDYT